MAIRDKNQDPLGTFRGKGQGGPAYIVKPDGTIYDYQKALWTPDKEQDRLGLSWIRGATKNWSWQGSSADQIYSKYGDYIVNSKGEADARANQINTDKKIAGLEGKYEKRLAEVTSQENTRNSLAAQIRALTGGDTDASGATAGPAGPAFNQALSQLSAGRNYGSSDLGSMLNFQVSDQQIVDDYNNSKLSRLNSVIERGNSQIAGITERINTANDLLKGLPAGDARRTSSEVFIKQLNDDLKSVTSAVTEAQDMQKNFTPIGLDSPEGLKEITSFRTFAQLPEERAAQQLYQIDPDSYRTAVGLGQKYREMATEPIGATTTPETEQLRQTIEDEALNQLRLGSTIGAEERRGYEQAIRGAQTARGNIFGLGPAVQEAAQIGAAGEQRKLARYGAAQQFLASGQSTGDALRADLAFRDALQQNRLGAAAGFIAGGPSIGNLAQARTANQQAQFQNYINANQAQPGQFATQPYSSQFYQTTNPAIPVQMSGQAAQIYNTMADYQANTYGAYTGALSRAETGSQAFGNIASGLGNLVKIPIPLCWVAREVYGIDNPKWLQFREWMLTKASDNLRNFYIEYGERIAESIRNKPRIKEIIRKWMDGKIK